MVQRPTYTPPTKARCLECAFSSGNPQWAAFEGWEARFTPHILPGTAIACYRYRGGQSTAQDGICAGFENRETYDLTPHFAMVQGPQVGDLA